MPKQWFTQEQLAHKDAVKNAKIVMDRQSEAAAKKVGFESFLKNNKTALAQDFWYKTTGSWLPADHISIQSILKDDKRMRKIANDFADHETNTHGGWNWIAQGADTLFNNTYTKDGASEDAKKNYERLLKSSGEIPAWGTGSRDLKEKLDVLAYGAGSTFIPGGIGVGMVRGAAKVNSAAKKVADLVANNKKKVIGTAILGSPLIYEGPFNIMDQAHDVKFGNQKEVSFGKLIDDTKDTYKSIGELAQMPFEEKPKEHTVVYHGNEKLYGEGGKTYTFPSRYQAGEHAQGLLSYLGDEKIKNSKQEEMILRHWNEDKSSGKIRDGADYSSYRTDWLKGLQENK